jgi:hypothetical protein
MAATNASFEAIRIPSGGAGDPGDAINIVTASGNSASFRLMGGQYFLGCVASTFGTVTLQRLGPDASTFLTAATAFSANGAATAYLPPGTYRVALA